MLKKEKMVKKNINSCLDSRHYILLFSTGSRGWFFEKESKVVKFVSISLETVSLRD